MSMEKPSAQVVGQVFVRQYYTLLNEEPENLHKFYGKDVSYGHGSLDSNGKPAEVDYGNLEIQKCVTELSFKDCHSQIWHVDSHSTLSEGVVVQVKGELSNNMQPMRRFVQTFVLAPEGTAANKFHVHKDVFTYQDEVFEDSDSEPPEESEEETQQKKAPQTSRSPPPENNRSFSWAYVTSKYLPPCGAVPALRITPHKIKVPPTTQLRVEVKCESQSSTQRPQREQRAQEQRLNNPTVVHRSPRPVCEGESSESEGRRMVLRYPDAHQLFVGNIPHDVEKTELMEFFEHFGSPVQKILSSRPIKLFGNVRLNVQEKKTREVKRRKARPHHGAPRGGGVRGPPSRGGGTNKPSFGSGRGVVA
uniref:GTPase activating protein (SH3 domain) binding protein 1 n=1 Tax=Gouania willdenowi TaxID=441366 RepID=A0A8C5HTQ8_GOUWI